MTQEETSRDGSGFEELEAAIASLRTKQDRGGAFEYAVLHFLGHDPRLDLAEAWLWADWPARQRLGLSRTDLGADPVVEDKDGNLVAIQARFRRDPHKRLRYDDVATFLAYRQDLFPRRILVSNTASRGRNLEAATVGRTDTDRLVRSGLVDSPTDWTGALEATRGPVAPERKKATPHPFQQAATADVGPRPLVEPGVPYFDRRCWSHSIRGVFWDA